MKLAASRTTVDEIADSIYRISTPSDAVPGGFTFNQFLIADEQPLLFHTGMRALFPEVREAVSRVLPVESLRYVAFSHLEPDECGALNEFLAAAPAAVPLCGAIASRITIADSALRPAKALAGGETLSLGKKTVEWFDTPHLPHGWDSGLLGVRDSRTLLCGDLFTQGGAAPVPLTESDILGPSEAFRARMDYFSNSPRTPAIIGRLADWKPRTLGAMHGSSFAGDGASLLRALAGELSRAAAR